MKIFLYFIGKPRDQSANAMADEYIKRCNRFAHVEMREIQPAKFDPWTKHPSAKKILLDPAGKLYDSEKFSKLMEETRDLVFIVGGADGLRPDWRNRGDLLLSLSPLTFPHELARVVLAEQLYRAFTMLRGYPYPR